MDACPDFKECYIQLIYEPFIVSSSYLLWPHIEQHITTYKVKATSHVQDNLGQVLGRFSVGNRNEASAFPFLAFALLTGIGTRWLHWRGEQIKYIWEWRWQWSHWQRLWHKYWYCPSCWPWLSFSVSGWDKMCRTSQIRPRSKRLSDVLLLLQRLCYT